MKKSLLSAVIISALMLCGCTESSSELPPDTPYNHGKNAIMETENGYYTNTSSYNGHMLRFYERDTDKQIYLCAKPECLHNGGEGCAATYKNLECINTILYDGAIYTLAIEDGDVISYSLYKAALDGTSFTKIGDAFSVSNSAGESYEAMGEMYFMIHKGYAYIPYHLTIGEGTFGFAGSGLVKMDINTGKTEQLFSGKDYFSAYPVETAVGSGEYVYYYLHGIKQDDPDNGTYRINIKTNETEKISDFAENAITIGDDYFYGVGFMDDGTCTLMKLDKNASSLAEQWTQVGGQFEKSPELFAYEDKIIAISPLENKITIFGENDEELGTSSFDLNALSGYDGELIKDFYISNEKIYAVIKPATSFFEDFDKMVFSVAVSDIQSGNGEWKLEYGIKAPWQLGINPSDSSFE